MSDKEIRETVYQACLTSAIQMGDRIKEMSWFGRNHKKESNGQ